MEDLRGGDTYEVVAADLVEIPGIQGTAKNREGTCCTQDTGTVAEEVADTHRDQVGVENSAVVTRLG